MFNTKSYVLAYQLCYKYLIQGSRLAYKAVIFTTHFMDEEMKEQR